MNFEIQTTYYFDRETKQLAKRYRSFIDDLAVRQICLSQNIIKMLLF